MGFVFRGPLRRADGSPYGVARFEHDSLSRGRGAQVFSAGGSRSPSETQLAGHLWVRCVGAARELLTRARLNERAADFFGEGLVADVLPGLVG